MSTMHDDLDDDDYVANLLKEDAKKKSKSASIIGIRAYMPQRATAEAPKPNKRFLRNILRETDSHNQALLAKEAEEARLRLKDLRQKEVREARQLSNRQIHRHSEEREGRPRTKRKRVDVIATDSNRLSPPTEFEPVESGRTRSKERAQDSKRRRRWEEDGEEADQRSSHRPHKRHRGQRDIGYTLDEEITRSKRRAEKQRRRRSRSRSRSRLSDDDRHHKSTHHKSTRHATKRSVSRDRNKDEERSDSNHRRRRSPIDSRSQSRSKERSRRKLSPWPLKAGKHRTTALSNSPPRLESHRNDPESKIPQEEHRHKKRSNRWDIGPSPPPPPASTTKSPRASRKQPDSDSDPLENIVGPLPPPLLPKVKVRGRGAISSSAMDSHFSASYDPNADVEPEVGESDDWEMALEAMRDRARFKQTQGDRLRAAGFTDEEVKKWEKGGEKMEEDVRWAKKGEGREWDRGKVVDEVTGHVELQPEWGRLKGT